MDPFGASRTPRSAAREQAWDRTLLTPRPSVNPDNRTTAAQAVGARFGLALQSTTGDTGAAAATYYGIFHSSSFKA